MIVVEIGSNCFLLEKKDDLLPLVDILDRSLEVERTDCLKKFIKSSCRPHKVRVFVTDTDLAETGDESGE